MSEKTVTINVEAFTAHHDECLAIEKELFELADELANIRITNPSIPYNLVVTLFALSTRLDKSISTLPAKFN